MNDLTEIGKITKPQGLKGEIKVQPLSNNPERFLNYKYIYLGKDCVKTNVINVRTQGGFVYMMIEGVNSIDDAELLRNQLIYIDKSQLPKLEEDEYFITDLIGCKVCDENNQELGVITDIDNYGVVDIITIKNKATKKEILFPFLDRVINSVDIDNKIIVIKNKEFDEVKVDED